MGKSAAVMGLSTGLGSAEMELQKMLIDERMKSTNHGINYQTLKAEHQSVQDEFTQSQGKLRQLLSDRQAEQENVKLLLAELRGEIMDQTRELEELRLQVMTPQRLELIIAQVQQEMEAPVQERFKKLEEETEKYKFDFIKLRYDYTFVMSQFEHQREEHARILEERRIHFDAELSRLEKDRKDQVAQNQGADTLHDGKQVEALLREKAQLHQRLEELEAEVGDLRAQKENYGQQAENVQHIQIQQLSESQTTLKSMEAERQSLHLKLERRESEVHSLTSEIQSLKYSHKLEMDGVKLEWNHSKGEMERERDALQVQSDGLQADAEVLKALVERHKDLLVEKERETAGRVQAACEEDFRKTATLHKEKLELDNRLAALQQQRALQDTAVHAQKEEWKQRVCSSQQGEESARREVKNLRSRIQQQDEECIGQSLSRYSQKGSYVNNSATLQQKHLSCAFPVGTSSVAPQRKTVGVTAGTLPFRGQAYSGPLKQTSSPLQCALLKGNCRPGRSSLDAHSCEQIGTQNRLHSRTSRYQQQLTRPSALQEIEPLTDVQIHDYIAKQVNQYRRTQSTGNLPTSSGKGTQQHVEVQRVSSAALGIAALGKALPVDSSKGSKVNAVYTQTSDCPTVPLERHSTGTPISM